MSAQLILYVIIDGFSFFIYLKGFLKNSITILSHPPEFATTLNEMKGQCAINKKVDQNPVRFFLVFEKTVRDIKLVIQDVNSSLVDDCVVWFAYPKKTSKKYKSDITRDKGWQVLGDLGYEGVRMVAIDEDWSALRFRKAIYIKTMKRDPSRMPSKKK